MDSRSRPPTDYRGLRKGNELRLLMAVVVVLVVVGGGLIGLLFGVGAMLSSLPCLLAGAGLIAGLYFLFVVLERWSAR